MDFDLSEQQVAMVDNLRRYLDAAYGFEQRRQYARSPLGYHAAAWQTYAEMGLLAIPFAEADGGLGGSMVDVMLIMRTLGAHLALEPYLSTVVLGGSVLRQAGSAARRRELLSAVAQGRLTLALAHLEPGDRHGDGAVATRARPDGDHYRISGHKTVVLDAPSAQLLIVSCRLDQNGASPPDALRGSTPEALHAAMPREGPVCLFLVDLRAAGVTLRTYPTHEGTRAADVLLDQVVVEASAMLGPAGSGRTVLAQCIDEANVALCSEAVGIMQALNAATLEHVRTRRQFGAPLASFQVIQHRMADMAVAAEQADAITTLAAARIGHAPAAERLRLVSAAKALVCQQARHVGQQAVQLHGGMGLTDELATAHLFKRLSLIGQTFGDADHHLARFAATLSQSGPAGRASVAAW